MKEKDIIALLKRQNLSEQSILDRLQIVDERSKEEIRQTLSALTENGFVMLQADNQYVWLDNADGIFLADVVKKNSNFVILRKVRDKSEVKVSGGETEDLLIGDLVYAKQFRYEVYHCLEYLRPVSVLKGTYSLDKNGRPIVFIQYLNDCGKHVYVEECAVEDVNQGDLVSASILDMTSNEIRVKVDEILVRSNEPGADITKIICENDAPIAFPESVLNEASRIPQEVRKEELAGRHDFRDEIVVTIDGDDAHDFDDAVQIKRFGKGYEVTVHIADVTHYVKKNHPLDDEAVKRGTSIYVADRVVPMLPLELSNGICSLNPGVDRLTLSVTMKIDTIGNVFDSKVERGIIRSKGRPTYNACNRYFETGESEYSKEINQTLDLLLECSKAIRKKRMRQGALKLDSSELTFVLDENGEPTDVVKKTQGTAEMMIEDYMIEANCEVAKKLHEHNIPVLYRIHENPPADKLAIFKDYLKRMNLLQSFPRDADISAKRINDFLTSIKNDTLRESVSKMLLRSMSKAKYSPEEKGHFGLAEMEHCHFTSPIRRYPDDIIHRLVKDYLTDGRDFDYDEVYEDLERMGEMTSAEEVRADVIERTVDDLECCKYMNKHIGELYHGKVSTLLQKGMFVETDLGIEGFLPYQCIQGDYYKFNERSFSAEGKSSNTVYTIGSPIDIKVMSVNLESLNIDFATPEYYDTHAVSLSEKEMQDLESRGIYIASQRKGGRATSDRGTKTAAKPHTKKPEPEIVVKTYVDECGFTHRVEEKVEKPRYDHDKKKEYQHSDHDRGGKKNYSHSDGERRSYGHGDNHGNGQRRRSSNGSFGKNKSSYRNNHNSSNSRSSSNGRRNNNGYRNNRNGRSNSSYKGKRGGNKR